jgi:hypothetical protein
MTKLLLLFVEIRMWKTDVTSTVFPTVLVAFQIGAPSSYSAGPPLVLPCLPLMLRLVKRG